MCLDCIQRSKLLTLAQCYRPPELPSKRPYRANSAEEVKARASVTRPRYVGGALLPTRHSTGQGECSGHLTLLVASVTCAIWSVLIRRD